MAFLGNKSLTELLKKSDVINPFKEERIENGAYELSLGEQVFLTDSNPKSVQTLNEDEDAIRTRPSVRPVQSVRYSLRAKAQHQDDERN